MIRSEFIKFSSVGLISTFLNYSVFILLFSFLDLNFLISSALGYFSGLSLGYTLNRLWTFSFSENSLTQKIKYLLIYLLSLLMGLVLLNFLVVNLIFVIEIANLFVIGFTTCTNFVGIKYWAFKG